ncbi:ATP synthase subunit b [Sphingomonas changbaiensis NBRC 104936]|uniref:ATP synthase subunit b n=1 Tax=Sphingomonas changbaiensis NBRC 104936 TaxID=1219043 RepID=A0A0E9MPM6_9SPHN|nr:ATP synthase F0 subunit B [Sphingomonas changbaiensis]GAO39371.1 ATP synthase subunit b [Sphingomonas changbaiensis NBRC 104936]
MPQFEVVNFAPQFVWLVISFAILYFGIVQFTVPKIGRVIGEREQTVSDDIQSAEAAKAEADRIEADYAASVAAAREQAREALNAARGQAAKAVEQRLAAANEEVERKQNAAQTQLDAARAKALADIEAVAAEAAADIVERLTGARPDSRTAVQAVQSVALAAE